jgi:hypothetical protein
MCIYAVVRSDEGRSSILLFEEVQKRLGFGVSWPKPERFEEIATRSLAIVLIDEMINARVQVGLRILWP